MITTTDRPAPTVVGAKSEVGFTIDPRNLAHVVSLLRDAYSDPITAVLREYSVNAADAHVEAGIPNKPIRVTQGSIFLLKKITSRKFLIIK